MWNFLRRLCCPTAPAAPTYEFMGIAPHCPGLAPLQDTNALDHLYPPPAVLQQWRDAGYDHACVYQAHWRYGERTVVYFFLDYPLRRAADVSTAVPKVCTAAAYATVRAVDPATTLARPGIHFSTLANRLAAAVA